MKKLFIIIIAIISLSSCSTKEQSNFRGCKYKVVSNLFSGDTEIIITGSYAPIDLYIIVLDQIIDNKESKGLKIKITDDNIKHLSKEDVLYIRENAVKIHDYDNMMTAVRKSQPIADRLTDYK